MQRQWLVEGDRVDGIVRAQLPAALVECEPRVAGGTL